MRRYESYKDSGVEWLGEVPSHWELGRISTYFTERRTKVSDKDYPALSVTKLGVFPQWENVAKTNDGDNRKLAKKGDFVINSRSDRKGSSGIAKQDGSVSLINIVLQPKKINSVYSEYLFKSYSFIEEFYRVGHGIVADLWTTRFEDIKNSLIIFPPLSEQQKIAQFLDDKIAKIDQAVDLAEKQIALLKEHKQILIQNAVTRGLNPDVPLKDSGVEWIGKVPEHWEVKQIKYLTKIYRGKFGHRPRNDPALYDGIYPFVQTGDVARANKYITNYTQTLNDKGIKVSQLFPQGALLMAIAANIGDVAILDFEAYAPDSIVGFTPNKEISLKFLYYCFITLAEELKRSAIQNTQANLNIERIGSIKSVYPNIEEQCQITNYLDIQIGKIDQTIELKTAHIEKLKEYKSVLINDVVTGKVRV